MNWKMTLIATLVVLITASAGYATVMSYDDLIAPTPGEAHYLTPIFGSQSIGNNLIKIELYMDNDGNGNVPAEDGQDKCKWWEVWEIFDGDGICINEAYDTIINPVNGELVGEWSMFKLQQKTGNEWKTLKVLTHSLVDCTSGEKACVKRIIKFNENTFMNVTYELKDDDVKVKFTVDIIPGVQNKEFRLKYRLESKEAIEEIKDKEVEFSPYFYDWNDITNYPVSYSLTEDNSVLEQTTELGTLVKDVPIQIDPTISSANPDAYDGSIIEADENNIYVFLKDTANDRIMVWKSINSGTSWSNNVNLTDATLGATYGLTVKKVDDSIFLVYPNSTYYYKGAVYNTTNDTFVYFQSLAGYSYDLGLISDTPNAEDYASPLQYVDINNTHEGLCWSLRYTTADKWKPFCTYREMSDEIPFESSPDANTISVTNSLTTNLTDYQIKLNFNWTAGMNNNFSNVRFRDTDNITNLTYWMESYTSGVNATAWIKVPNITANSTTLLHRVINPITEVVSASNGTATFLFFDDFSSDTIGTLWTNITTHSGINIAGGVLEIDMPSGAGVVRALTTKTYTFGSPITIDTRWRANAVYGASDTAIYWGAVGTNLSLQYQLFTSSYRWRFWTPTGWLSPNYNGWTQDTNYHIIEHKINGTNSSFLFDGTERISTTTATPPVSNNYTVGMSTNNIAAKAYYDYVFFRKFASIEPAVSIGVDISTGCTGYLFCNLTQGTGYSAAGLDYATTFNTFTRENTQDGMLCADDGTNARCQSYNLNDMSTNTTAATYGALTRLNTQSLVRLNDGRLMLAGEKTAAASTLGYTYFNNTSNTWGSVNSYDPAAELVYIFKNGIIKDEDGYCHLFAKDNSPATSYWLRTRDTNCNFTGALAEPVNITGFLDVNFPDSETTFYILQNATSAGQFVYQGSTYYNQFPQAGGLYVRAYDEETGVNLSSWDINIYNSTNSESQSGISSYYGNWYGLTTLRIDKTGYYTRYFYMNMTSEPQYLDAFLLNLTDGQVVTFLVVDRISQPIGDVLLTAQRNINGTWLIVEQKYTDVSGASSFFLNPDMQYLITAYKTGYSTFQDYIIPTSTSYTIRLQTGIASNYTDYFLNVTKYKATPIESTALLSHNVSFNYEMYAQPNTLDWMYMNVSFENGTMIYEENLTSSTGGDIEYNYTTTSDEDLVMVYSFKREDKDVPYEMIKTIDVFNYITTNLQFDAILERFKAQEGIDASKFDLVMTFFSICVGLLIGLFLVRYGGFQAAIAVMMWYWIAEQMGFFSSTVFAILLIIIGALAIISFAQKTR